MKIHGIDHKLSSDELIVYVLDGPMNDEQKVRFQSLFAAKGYSKPSVAIQGWHLSVKRADMAPDSLRHIMVVLAEV